MDANCPPGRARPRDVVAHSQVATRFALMRVRSLLLAQSRRAQHPPEEEISPFQHSRGDNEGLGINIPAAGNKPVEVGNSSGVDCNRVRQTADRKGHGAWVARHTNCCWA